MVLQELTMEESLEGGQYILQTGGQVVTGEEVVTELQAAQSQVRYFMKVYIEPFISDSYSESDNTVVLVEW